MYNNCFNSVQVKQMLEGLNKEGKMDYRQFKNECEGCRHNGLECRLWNKGLCHEQNYYEEELPQSANSIDSLED